MYKICLPALGMKLNNISLLKIAKYLLKTEQVEFSSYEGFVSIIHDIEEFFLTFLPFVLVQLLVGLVLVHLFEPLI